MVFNLKISSIERNIKNYIVFITEILKKEKITNKINLVNIPIQKKRITLLKSPHVNKKAREQFEIKKYVKIIQFKVNEKTFLDLKKILLNKPKHIKINIRRII